MTTVSVPPRVMLDANVLFPFTLRDTLLRAAAADLYRLRWSAQILNEMERALVREGATTGAKAARLRDIMERCFDNAMVTGHERHIDQMRNHPGDRHVAAAAFEAKAQLIVTQNLKDFRELPAGIEAISPDAFLCGLLQRHRAMVLDLLTAQAVDLANPPLTLVEILDGLSQTTPGFVAQVAALNSHSGLSR
jgi:predicted nucleic acid-binding protein